MASASCGGKASPEQSNIVFRNVAKGPDKSATVYFTYIDESQEIGEYCGLADRVIDQTRRRVIEGRRCPTAEKVYSIFEPHTDVIKRGNVVKCEAARVTLVCIPQRGGNNTAERDAVEDSPAFKKGHLVVHF